jgi:hypothetical protein
MSAQRSGKKEKSSFNQNGSASSGAKESSVLQQKKEARLKTAQIRREFMFNLMKVIDILNLFETIKIFIKGGAVRDSLIYKGHYNEWEFGNTDIDIVFEFACIASTEAIMTLFEKFSTAITLFGATTKITSSENNEYKFMYLQKLVITFQNVKIDVDLIYGTKTCLDFNVNALMMNHNGIMISSNKNGLKYYDILSHIQNRTFKVMWSIDMNLAIIVSRIQKMEARRWKCLNFEEIVAFADQRLRRFALKTSVMEKDLDKKQLHNCAMCQFKVKKYDIIPKLKCVHSETVHHRCLLSHFLNILSEDDVFEMKCLLCAEKIE